MAYGQREEYENGLRSLGCEEIGKGLYSNVFAIPMTDKVIKVADMDEWPTYISWATRHGYAGTFAPKVFSLKFKDGFYVAVMERLVCTIGNIRFKAKTDHVDLYNKMGDWMWRDTPTPQEPDQFIAFLKELKATKLTGDLHDANVMVRRDGQVVITDPCSGCFSSSQYRIRKGALSAT